MKVYLASSWRNPLQPTTVKLLRMAGHEVYDFKDQDGFRWSEVDESWRDWSAEAYRNNLSNPIAERGFKRDFDAMQWADVGVLLLPCGRSAHLELGWMAGAGKRTVIWTRDGEEPELMAKLATKVCVTLEEVLEFLQ